MERVILESGRSEFQSQMYLSLPNPSVPQFPHLNPAPLISIVFADNHVFHLPPSLLNGVAAQRARACSGRVTSMKRASSGCLLNDWLTDGHVEQCRCTAGDDTMDVSCENDHAVGRTMKSQRWSCSDEEEDVRVKVMKSRSGW